MRFNSIFAAAVLVANLAAAQTTAAKLESDALHLRYDILAQDLVQTPSGQLHDVFAGVLADRTSRFDEATHLLTPLADSTTLSPTQRAFVLGSLADVNFKTFHYAAANRFYNQLFACCSSALEPALLKDDQDDNAALKLLLDAPLQTIDITTPIDLPTHLDALGDFTADLSANGVTVPWILDTGANISTISASFARKLGLHISDGVAQTMGATGVENPLHVAILPELHIGSATIHNVVLLVLPDSNLKLPTSRWKSYTIPAILGYPVFQALGVIRFTHHHFLAGPTLEAGADPAPIYFDKLSPLIAVSTHGKLRPFLFDSGANVSFLFAPYFRDFPLDFDGQPQAKARQAGAGGVVTSKVYAFQTVNFQLGSRDVTLHHIAAHTGLAGTLADRYEGSLGRDLLDNFDSITLDFIHDRASLSSPLPDFN